MINIKQIAGISLLVFMQCIIIPAPSLAFELGISGVETNAMQLSWSNSPAPPYMVIESQDLVTWSNTAKYILPVDYNMSHVISTTDDGNSRFFKVTQMEPNLFHQGVITNGVAKHQAIAVMTDITNDSRVVIGLTDTDENGTYDLLTKEQMLITESNRVARLDATAHDTSTGRVASVYIDVPGLMTNISLSYSVATDDDWLTTTNSLNESILQNFASNALPSIIPYSTNEFAIYVPKVAASNVTVISSEGSYVVLDPDPLFGPTNMQTPTFLEPGGAGVACLPCGGGLRFYCDVEGGRIRQQHGPTLTSHGVKKWSWTWRKRFSLSSNKNSESAPLGSNGLGTLDTTVDGLEPGIYSVSIKAIIWTDVSRSKHAVMSVNCYAGTVEVKKKSTGCDDTTPVLIVTPVSISASCEEGSSAGSQSFEISNGGDGSLSFQVSVQNTDGVMSWLALGGDTSGVCDEGDSPKTVTVYFPTSDSLSSGTTKSGNIKVETEDEASSVSVTLTVTETNSPPPTDGLVAYYPFDGDALDYSGNGNHGIEEGNAYEAGRVGQSARFYGGDSSHIRINQDWISSSDDEITVTAWVNIHSTTEAWILSQRQSDKRGDFGFVRDRNGKLMFYYHPVSGRPVWVGRTISSIPSGWAFIAAAYNVTSNQVTLYINQSLETSTMVADGSTTYHNAIGGVSTASYNQYDTDGNIDELRIYNRVLSLSEVQELYQQGQ